MDEASKFPSISQHRIPYPLPQHLHRLHDLYEHGEQSLSDTLVPSYNPDQKCKYSNAFSSEDLIGLLLVRSLCTSILMQHRAVATAGACTMDKMTSCLIFIYDLLFQYLHLMIESKDSLTNS